MCLLNKKRDKLLIIAYCFCVSFIILSLTSKCSFLYPFNDWDDANAFFTVGKSMMNGIVPYLDLFEQKGLLLYFIYGIGYLISNTTFRGVFVLEVISWIFTLYFVYKIINLFLNKKWSFIIIPIFMMLICTSKAFASGGSAEEFSLPFMIITLFYFLDYFKNNNLSYKRLFIAGLCAGCILVIKYTLLGYWFAFMATIFFSLSFNKEYKKSFFSCIVFLSGMIIPFLITLIYMGINGGIKKYFDVYFIFNMTFYENDVTSIFERLFLLFKGLIMEIYNNGIIILLLLVLMPLLLLNLKISKKGKLAIIGLLLFTILGVYWGLRFYRYYLFPIEIFMLISLISIAIFLDKYLKIERIKGLIIISLIVSFISSYYGANYINLRFKKKEDLFQYKFAEVINKEENPTLVNMGSLDCGVFTMSGVIPTTYYFEKQNISYKVYPDNIDSFKEYINNKSTMFIVFYTKHSLEKLQSREEELFNNYELIMMERQIPKTDNNIAYLFKRKE